MSKKLDKPMPNSFKGPKGNPLAPDGGVPAMKQTENLPVAKKVEVGTIMDTVVNKIPSGK